MHDRRRPQLRVCFTLCDQRKLAAQTPGIGGSAVPRTRGVRLRHRGREGQEEQTPLTAGMVTADGEGRPTGYVADKTWFDETFPV